MRTLLAATRGDDPQTYPPGLIASAEHRALALRAAERSMTLVRNEGHMLPLSKSLTSLAVLGPLADTANIGDHGSSQVFPPYAVTPLAGLKALLPGADVRYEAEAGEWVKGADAAIVVVGCGHGDEGEYVPADESNAAVGGDRTSLRLRPAEVELIRRTAALNPRTIVVLIGGSTILMDEWHEAVPSIVFAYYPGMEGGTAIAETLFGDVNPGGKLPRGSPCPRPTCPPSSGTPRASSTATTTATPSWTKRARSRCSTTATACRTRRLPSASLSSARKERAGRFLHPREHGRRDGGRGRAALCRVFAVAGRPPGQGSARLPESHLGSRKERAGSHPLSTGQAALVPTLRPRTGNSRPWSTKSIWGRAAPPTSLHPGTVELKEGNS